MVTSWDPDTARIQMGKILDWPSKHENWRNCDAIIALLPLDLQPPYTAAVSVEDVLMHLFKSILAPGERSSDESKLHAAKPEMRAARAYLGWIENEYELICKIAQDLGRVGAKPLGPNASEQEREAHRIKLLRFPQVRRALAAHEMDPGLGTRRVKDSRRNEIADALWALYAFL